MLCCTPRTTADGSMLFTIVATILLRLKNVQALNNVIGTALNQHDISHVLYCQQLKTVLFYQYVNSLDIKRFRCCYNNN